MLMPSFASAVNILLATPACERIPTPTIDTFTMSPRVATSACTEFLWQLLQELILLWQAATVYS